MRIVQFSNTLDARDGGPARNSYELNRAFNSKNEIYADLFWIHGASKDAVSHAELPVSPQKSHPRGISLSGSDNGKIGLSDLVKIVRNSDAVIIHGYYLAWAPLVSLIAGLCNSRVYCMPHGALTSHQQKYSRSKKSFFDLGPGLILRSMLTAFVTGSQVEADELAAKFAQADVRIAGVGVRVPSQVRNDSGVSNPIRLCTVSRIAPKKRIDIAIETVAELKRRGLPATLRIAGSGDDVLVSRLRALAVQLQVENDVAFVGQLGTEEKAQLLLDSDFFLLPSEDENFGIGFAEAVSYGLPAIASSAVAAATDYPREAGTILDSCTATNMASAIMSLLEPGVYLRALEENRKHAANQFSWNSAVNKWIDAIK